MSGSTFAKEITVDSTKLAYEKITNLTPERNINASSGESTPAATPAATTASTTSDTQDKFNATIKTTLNNLAQIKFFELKYMDRTGGINLLFSPKWMPGTTGTAFSRYPDPDGMFVDFYVTQVRHSFTPGSATTHVSFAGGRVGAEPIGVDKYNLFNYDSSKMLEVQKRYIENFGK
jgi:hypothetical protein